MRTVRFHRFGWMFLLLILLAACSYPATASPPPSPQILFTEVPPTIIPQFTATLSPTLTATPAVDLDQITGALNTLVPAAMQKDGVIGCSVAVAYPDAATGKIQTSIFNYGTLSRDSNKPTDADTEYEIGSLTKLFTANVLVQLVQEGLMNLDDPVQKYLPPNVHVPSFNGRSISLRQLVVHTSGLPRTLPSIPSVRKIDGALVSGYATEEEIFDFLNSYQLTRPPGSKTEYSNLGYALLAIAEEQAANDTFENLVTQKIITPLDLNNTRILLSAAQKADLAQGYSEKQTAAPPFAVSGEMLGAGGLRSTIHDLASYLAANIDPTNTSLEAVLSMSQEKPDKGFGLGWFIANPGTPQELFNKSGKTVGFDSYIGFLRVPHTGFALVCNGHLLPDLVPQINALMGVPEAPIDSDE